MVVDRMNYIFVNIKTGTASKWVKEIGCVIREFKLETFDFDHPRI